MKKNKIYFILVILVLIACLCTILIINKNKSEIVDRSNTNLPSKNEVNEMTDEQLIEKTILGEETLDLDNIENDTILNNIESAINEKDPLADMPGE